VASRRPSTAPTTAPRITVTTITITTTTWSPVTTASLTAPAELQGWFVLSGSAFDRDAGELERRVAQLQARLSELQPGISGRVSRLNRMTALVLEGAAEEYWDVEALLCWVGAHLPGSYGFLSRGTDELVLRRGHLAPAAEPEEPDPL
jgi:hypothetical protein